MDQNLDLQQDALQAAGSKRKAALALKRDPNYTVQDICRIVGISRNTYYKYTRAETSAVSGT